MLKLSKIIIIIIIIIINKNRNMLNIFKVNNKDTRTSEHILHFILLLLLNSNN